MELDIIWFNKSRESVSMYATPHGDMLTVYGTTNTSKSIGKV